MTRLEKLEEIARLARERDASKAFARRWKGLARRLWESEFNARMSAEHLREHHDHKVEEWSSSCDILAEERDEAVRRAAF